jgi:hypothetical protein
VYITNGTDTFLQQQVSALFSVSAVADEENNTELTMKATAIVAISDTIQG